MRVKVIGAGSIGNHLSHAARQLEWRVDLVDIDPQALARTQYDIYPARYGDWDTSIRLFQSDNAPVGGYDLICVGTPPDSHIELARAALAEKPQAILVEKPICRPDLIGAGELASEAASLGVAVFVGYDHVIGQASRLVAETLSKGELGEVQTLDVEFREHWGGIFGAHPWLAGPWDTYLGFWEKGGGASGEHSHAANLWQYFANVLGFGRIVEVDARLDFVRDGRVDYDRLCLMTFRTESGLVGRCVQDVVTKPARKWARVQGDQGYVEWWCGREPGVDVVSGDFPGQPNFEYKVSKTRPDDFIEELKHIEAALAGMPGKSPISVERGLDTMLVVAAAHLSNQTGSRVAIDYSKGWRTAALRAIGPR